VVGVAGDASLDPEVAGRGHKAWAAWVPAPPAEGGRAGPDVVLFDTVPAAEQGWDSSSLELMPLVAALRRFGVQWRGRFVVFLTDNLGNMYRINKGRAAYGSRSLALLRELYALADAHRIDFIALWLPRAANGTLDALSKCRSVDEAAAWAEHAGFQFVRGP
jgi:hypothetical protein